jgi:hypothetical protein
MRLTFGNFVPASPMGNNNWVLVYSDVGGTNASWLLPDDVAGNYFQLTGIASTDGGGAVTVENDLTPVRAQNIDTKMDDGGFDTGTVRASNRPVQVYANGLAPTSGANQCATLKAWGGTVDGYQTGVYPDVRACQLSFRWSNGGD